jgi:hypothetical protein
LTKFLQAIDHHVGIQYKQKVMKGVRLELMKLYQDAVEKVILKEGDNLDIEALKPHNKCILITQIVGEYHKEIAKLGAF